MKYGSKAAEHLFKLAAKTGKTLGFEFMRGAEAFAPEQRLWENIIKEIDRCFLVVIDTSQQSWWISLELYRAMEHKYCILLICEDGERPQVPPPVGEFKHLQYSLLSPSKANKFQTDLDNSIRHVMCLAGIWRNKITQGSIEDGTRELPALLVDPELKLNDQQVSIDEVFQSLLEPGARRLAVVARSGLGKTLLLGRLARWLHDRQGLSPIHSSQLYPLVIFLRAADLPADVNLTEYVKGHVLGKRPRPDRSYCSKEFPSLFESYRLAGRICVIVDALDEFFVLNRGKKDHLLQELDKLFQQNFSVVVSCRQNLWVQEIRRREYETLQITFTEKQASRLLSGVNLPGTARVNGRLRSFLLNPLILSFIATAYDESKSTLSFASRANLYDLWAQWKCKQESPRYRVDDPKLLLGLFDEVALEMLRHRRASLQVGELPQILVTCRVERAVSEAELSASGVLELRGDGELEFVHPSIYEYFIAHRLKADFLTVENAETSPEQLSSLELGRVELDFPQSAVYGFLSEMLGSTYFGKLKTRLKAVDCQAPPSALIRNLVEYLGMTYRGDSDPDLALLLLDLIEHPNLNARIRLDAARALERICPLAPHPYFEHVSDWGAREYSELVAIATRTTERPWVIRGYGKEKLGVGKHWAWVDNVGEWPDTDLQAEVSRRLGTILEQMQRDSSDSKIQVNVSHAWIRWYHPASRESLDNTLAEAARQFDQSKALENRAIYENLMTWVGKYY